MNCRRVLLADDHAELLALAAQIIGRESDVEVVRIFDNGRDVVDEAMSLNPDLIVLDISMPTVNGIAAANQLKAAGSLAKVLFLTVHEDQDYLRSALATGALGYVVKARMATDLGPAVQQVLAGGTFISQT